VIIFSRKSLYKEMKQKHGSKNFHQVYYHTISVSAIISGWFLSFLRFIIKTHEILFSNNKRQAQEESLK